jgi:3-oxoacyl-ACP reductase-like protein
LLSEPESRLGSEEAAKAWLRGVATDYLKAHGIELAAPSSGSTALTATISSAELEKIQARHKALLRQQVELYLAYLQDADGRAAGQSLAEASDAVAKLQAQLDYWMAEHGGEEYAEGIQPIFSALKARRYDSWWNWARQTALELYSQSLAGSVLADQETLASKISSLTSRADANLVDFLEYLAHGQASAFHPAAGGERGQLAKHLADSLWKEAKKGLGAQPVFRPFGKLTGPQTSITAQGRIEYREVPRPRPSFPAYVEDVKEHGWLHLASRDDANAWAKDAGQSALYLEALRSVCSEGLSFAGKTFLMTGGGRASIGGEMLRGLLMGGATVVLTTSSYSRKSLGHFRALYEECGAKGSALIVVPFNQASKQDVGRLVDYIYGELGSDLDGIIPFGAISEAGKSLLDGVEGRSELAHRLMLTNVVRLLGAVAQAKASRSITTRPAQVLLPLSPNHGTFGYDGLYGESKAALEALLQKWHSEAWNDYLSVVGAVIGYFCAGCGGDGAHPLAVLGGPEGRG